MHKKWKIQTAESETMAWVQRELNCHVATAAILALRGYLSKEDLAQFLRPSFRHLRSPFELAGMAKAVSRLCHGLSQMEKILVFGDYDVDGITSTILLYQFLRDIGADVTYYIPHRIREGYGLKSKHINELVLPGETSILLTVDCGISSHNAVGLAQRSGVDVIITDHHDAPAQLPPAFAIIDPKRRDCASGLMHLSGVGIAFYLAMALRKGLRDMGFFASRKEPNLKQSCDLVAMGTISDVVPMVKENRILTRAGLEILRSGHRPGINALARVCGVAQRHISSEDIAYRLAPRLNAAGRLDHAKVAARLMDTPTLDKARQYAEQLDHLNLLRQKEEARVLDEILKYLDGQPDWAQKSCLVCASPDWHEGVIGIVAARLTQMYCKPTILISLQDSMGKGSARSIPGVDIRSALEACSHLLHRYGGHPMAAGLQISANRIVSFWDCLDKEIRRRTSAEDLTPILIIDYCLELTDITPKLLDEIVALGPFGPQNPEPVFMASNVHVLASKIVGKGHKRMRLSASPDKKGPAWWGIQFNPDPDTLEAQRFTRIAYRLQWNHWNHNKSIQLLIDETQV